MGYTAWSVTASEVPTVSKWNILGENDASFNDGTGFADGIILTRHINTGAVTPAKRSGGFKAGLISGSTLGSTGNKAITGVGFQPKAVRFIMLSSASTTSVIDGHGYMDAGFQYYVASSTNGTTSNRNADTSHCIAWITAGSVSSTPSLLCSRVSLDADGFTINVDIANSGIDVVYESYA